jgi:ADP-ribosylglycohydrolase
MESLCLGYSPDNLAQIFCKWLFEAYWTASGAVFDAGITTVVALDRIKTEGISALQSGSKYEHDNGNGSLMRILPAALYFSNEPTEFFLERIHEISAITHAHPRTLVGCGIYSLLVKQLLVTDDKFEALRNAVTQALDYYNCHAEFKNELSNYLRVISFQLTTLEESDICSSGYIVDTLEAALWCFLKNDTTESVLLSAVNLGLDTDTTGTVAGGLAGIVYGLNGVPHEWIESLSLKTKIQKLTDNFADIIAGTNTLHPTNHRKSVNETNSH